MATLFWDPLFDPFFQGWPKPPKPDIISADFQWISGHTPKTAKTLQKGVQKWPKKGVFQGPGSPDFRYFGVYVQNPGNPGSGPLFGPLFGPPSEHLPPNRHKRDISDPMYFYNALNPPLIYIKYRPSGHTPKTPKNPPKRGPKRVQNHGFQGFMSKIRKLGP